MKPRMLVGVVLALVITMVVSSTKLSVRQAMADVTWPQEFALTAITKVVAHGVDNLTLLSGNFVSLASDKEFINLRAGVEVNSFPVNANFVFDPRDSDVTAPDGTVFGIYRDTSGPTQINYLAAVNNGRIKWATSVATESQCSWTSNTGSHFDSISIGADGNLYMILHNDFWQCAKYLAGFNASTGVLLFMNYLGNDGYNGVMPRVWTYSDKIITIDTSGMERVYAYDGTENVSARYQFLGTTGTAYANSNGRMFLVTKNIGDVWGCVGGRIYYHDLDGSYGSMDRLDGSCCGPEFAYQPGPNGDLIANSPVDTIYNFHVVTGTYSTLSVPVPTGYSASSNWSGVMYMSEDENGNAIILRDLGVCNSSVRGTFVDYVDASNNAVTNLYSRVGDGTPSNTPNPFWPDVYGSYMYLPVSYSQQTTEPYQRDYWVEKISTGSFGTPIKPSFGFSGDISGRKKYVAMGDSFSSGEGNPPFEVGTDISNMPFSTTNVCHRSDAAYPKLLGVDSSMNLNLTDFVACSGATTADVMYGGNPGTGAWGEPAQINALSDDTQVVTLTIGGNDVAFGDYLIGCLGIGCGPGTGAIIYDAMMEGIYSSAFQSVLEATYEAILQKAPNAELYVADYPYIVNDYQTICDIVDLSGAYNVTTALNSVIHAAIDNLAANNTRIHAVYTNLIDSPFIGKNVCGGEPYFNSILIYPIVPLNRIAGSFHPNALGQAAYKSLF